MFSLSKKVAIPNWRENVVFRAYLEDLDERVSKAVLCHQLDLESATRMHTRCRLERLVRNEYREDVSALT